MKSLKVLCAIGMIASFFSCAYQEDTAAFFIENELNKKFVMERVVDEAPNSSIFHNTELDLTSIESYDRYIQRLVNIDVNEFTCSFSNYQGEITNGQLFIDDIPLGAFNSSMQNITIDNQEILTLIAQKFLEKTSLEFSFVGESNTTHSLTVDIEIDMLATFVH